MGPGLREELRNGSTSLGIHLDDEAISRFDLYIRLLQSWGQRMNLSSRLQSREIVVTHFLDSLAGLPLIGGGEGGRVLDLGTGAGFPGIPLKIARPGLEVTLLDGTGKKVTFCREVIRETGLSGISAEWGRAEDLARDPAYAGAFDCVASRAVAKAASLVSLSLPFLKPSGSILLYKGRPEQAELDALGRLCAKKGLTATRHPVAVPGLEASRVIIVVQRIPA